MLVALQFGNSLGTPRCFEQRVRKLLRNKEMRFAPGKEWQRAKVKGPRRSDSRHRQSRWLSKERGWERGKRDRCQNKGDSKSCPDLGAKEWLGVWPLADFARSKQKWGRTVRMGLDYTRQCSMASFTKSRTIS